MPFLNIIIEYWYLFFNTSVILVGLWVIDRYYDKQDSIFDEEDINLHQTQDKSLLVAVGDMFIWCAEKGHLEENAPT